MKPVYINQLASIHAESSTQEGTSFLTANEPDYKGIITNANLRRRMSRIIKMGVACGLECLKGMESEQIHAIITATGLGCLADTEKFMNTLIDNEEQLLNPTAFIQSTFNTIGSQIALLLQIHAYNTTYVHRGLSFEGALLDGMMQIYEGNDNVLVGALDELTPTSYAIQQRLKLFEHTTAGEGAQFFLLSSRESPTTFAKIVGVESFIHMLTTQEVSNRIGLFLTANGLLPSDIEWFITGKNGNEQQDHIYTELERMIFPKAKHSTFKDRCGEYQTASSYAVWQTAQALKKEDCRTKYALIYNQFQYINHSLILMAKNI